ncbi:hypothetical protein [Nocardia rhamnosiphila]
MDPEKKRQLHELHIDSRALLERLADRLPTDKLATYRRYSDAGEWSELLDVLSATLVKLEVVVTPAERDALADLMARFAQPLEEYAYLGDPEGVLSRLNVTEISG